MITCNNDTTRSNLSLQQKEDATESTFFGRLLNSFRNRDRPKQLISELPALEMHVCHALLHMLTSSEPLVLKAVTRALSRWNNVDEVANYLADAYRKSKHPEDILPGLDGTKVPAVLEALVSGGRRDYFTQTHINCLLLSGQTKYDSIILKHIGMLPDSFRNLKDQEFAQARIQEIVSSADESKLNLMAVQKSMGRLLCSGNLPESEQQDKSPIQLAVFAGLAEQLSLKKNKPLSNYYYTRGNICGILGGALLGGFSATHYFKTIRDEDYFSFLRANNPIEIEGLTSMKRQFPIEYWKFLQYLPRESVREVLLTALHLEDSIQPVRGSKVYVSDTDWRSPTPTEFTIKRDVVVMEDLSDLNWGPSYRLENAALVMALSRAVLTEGDLFDMVVNRINQNRFFSPLLKLCMAAHAGPALTNLCFRHVVSVPPKKYGYSGRIDNDVCFLLASGANEDQIRDYNILAAANKLKIASNDSIVSASQYTSTDYYVKQHIEKASLPYNSLCYQLLPEEVRNTALRNFAVGLSPEFCRDTRERLEQLSQGELPFAGSEEYIRSKARNYASESEKSEDISDEEAVCQLRAILGPISSLEERLAAARTLAKSGKTETIDGLLSGLTSTDRHIVLASATALSEWRWNQTLQK